MESNSQQYITKLYSFFRFESFSFNLCFTVKFPQFYLPFPTNRAAIMRAAYQEAAYSHLIPLSSSYTTFLTRTPWTDMSIHTQANTHTHARNLSFPCQPNLLLTWRMDTPSSNENKSLPFSFCLSVSLSFLHSLHLFTPFSLQCLCFLPFDFVAISLMPPISDIIDQRAAAC